MSAVWERMMRWYQRLFRRARTERQLDAELRFHVEQQIADYFAAGMRPEEARRRARLEFGGLDQVKEECRDVGGARFVETLIQDVRYGLRQLRRNPGFTAVAVITLALGIGATAAIFTVFNTVLLQPLPYPDSGRIVQIARRQCDGCGTSASVPMFVYWEENNPGFEDLTAYGIGASVNLSGGDKPELVDAMRASRNYFRLFGAHVVLGRTFTAAEDHPGGPRVLVMSYGLWQRRFGGDLSILGKAISLEGASYTVIGILSPGFKSYPVADVWMPLQADPSGTNQAHTLIVDGRLPPGVTLAQANSWMAVIGKRYVQTHSQQIGNDDKLKVTTLQQQITGNIRPALLILLGAVGLVLLIACANVANLLLARGTGRQREIAVRTAIGAGRGRIVRQLLTESLLLALAGGALGLVLGSLGVRALMALAPVYVPRVQEITANAALDSRTAGFAALLVVITVVLFGLFPALQIAHSDLNSSLKESSGRTGAGPAHSRTRGILVASEMAMAVVLLSGAALLIRSFVALHTQSLGFDSRNILTMEISLAGRNYSKSSEVDRLGAQIVERIEHVPGVESAAVTSAMPLTGGGMDMIFNIPGRPPAKGQKFNGDVQWRIVSPSYFHVLRIPLLSGRLLHNGEPSRTVVINRAMAREFWPKTNPVGRSILIGAGLGASFDEGAAMIVGVVGDVRLQLGNEPVPIMYQIPRQVPDGAMALMDGVEHSDVMVRTEPGVSPMSISSEAQRLLMAGYGLAATKIRTMSQVSLDSTARRNFSLILLGLFAAIALLLAAVGLYGVIAYSVSQRSHEIGIRIALGAQKHDVLRLVVGQGMILALSGVVVGIAGAFGLMRLLSSLLYGVKPGDPITFIAVSLLLTSVAMLACYIPARRAARVDPVTALRHE